MDNPEYTEIPRHKAVFDEPSHSKFLTRSLGCAIALLCIACAAWAAFCIIYCTAKAIVWFVALV